MDYMKVIFMTEPLSLSESHEKLSFTTVVLNVCPGHKVAVLFLQKGEIEKLI